MISSMGGYRCCHIQFWNMVIMEKEKRYVASISGGKDSMAMVLGLMEKGWPLTHCVYFDTGMEFSCIRKNIEKVRLELEQYGCELVILQPERHFLEEMLLRRIKCRDGSSHYGSYWCGGPCRWMTRLKINACEKYVKSFVEKGGMTLKAKLCLTVPVSLLLLFMFITIENTMMRMIIIIMWLTKVIVFTRMKTIKVETNREAYDGQ